MASELNNKKYIIDTEFKKLIESIKSNTVNLSNREDRQLVALWVNKLCDPSFRTTSETERKNRNLYAHILLKMIQRSHIKKPFTERPGPGKLPTIPVYMSSYMDDTDPFGSTNDVEPEWLLSKDFEDSMLLQSFNYDKFDDIDSKNKHVLSVEDSCIFYSTKKDTRDFFQTPEANELEFYLRSQEESITANKARNKTPVIASETTTEDIDAIELDDYSILQKFEDIANEHKYTTSTNQCIDDLSKEKALQDKLEFLENKIEVESTKIQQQQDTMVKSILHRKNNEMTEIKLLYQKKISELEAVVDTRDRTISTLSIQLREIKEQRDNDAGKLKGDVEKSAKEYENKMNEKVNSMENEMKHLKRSHYENVEKLVAENERNIITAKEILMDENMMLKENTSKLTERLKGVNGMKDAAIKERDICIAKEEECQQLTAKLRAEVSEINVKVAYLEKENSQLSGDKQRLEKNADDMKNDAVKANANIVELRSKIDAYKSALEKLECTTQSEVKEAKIRYKEKLVESESSMNKKIQTLQNDFGIKEDKYKSMLEQSSFDVKEKEIEIQCLSDKLINLSKGVKHAIELLKNQAEEKSSSMFEELNNKLFQLHSSLATAQEKIRRQKSNIVQRFDEQRNKYESKHSNYKSDMETMYSKLQEKYEVDVTGYSEKLARQRLEHEEKLKGLLPLHIKIELEDTIESMRQQVVLLQSQIELLQEELDTVARFNLSCKSNGYNFADTTHIFSE